jgi:aryl-alcohol dehydrogenase-like predicted oxidoreductase
MSTQSPMADNEAGAERLGGTVIIGGDMPVHRLGFGAMRLCGPGVWGEPADPAQAKGVLKRVLELGITLIDTADAYGPEVNERLIAENALSLSRGDRHRHQGRSDATQA